MNTRTNLSRFGIAVGIFLLLVVLGFVIRGHSAVSHEEAQRGNWLEAQGIATRADYLKTVQLQDSTTRRNQLTEQEVDWLLAFANNPRFQGTSKDNRQMYVAGVLEFASIKQLPKTRLKGVYNFGVHLVRTPDQGDMHNSWAGCRILGNLKDKNAIPEIQPLLQSSDPQTRRFAKNALDDLGIEIPPSP